MALQHQGRLNNAENAENALGNRLQLKRGLQSSKGTTNLQRAALGEIQNARPGQQAGPSKPELRKQQEQPALTRNVEKEKEKVEVEQDEGMDISLRQEEKPELHFEDIDADDENNPQLVAEYVGDIYNYLRRVESTQSIRADYLSGQTEVIPKMRAVLIDWLVGVHLQFHLLQETLYTTVAILDRFLQDEVGSIKRQKLQLVGVAAMLIAAKYEEIYAPEVKDFVYITDRAYSERDILKMEIRILATLKFDLGRPLPLHFLRRASKAGGVEAATHTLAKYIMELSLGAYGMCAVAPSKLAAAALLLSIHLLDPTSSLQSVWTPGLVHYTHYTLASLAPVVHQLAATLAAAPTAKLATVYQKYSGKKFMKIARIPYLDTAAILQPGQ